MHFTLLLQTLSGDELLLRQFDLIKCQGDSMLLVRVFNIATYPPSAMTQPV